jgi:hypothetical protein
MFQSRRLNEKICGQGQKNVLGGTFPANLMKLFVLFYGFLKMTPGCHALE